MDEQQKLALRMMDERRLGAVLTRLGWTWPQDVRESTDAAAAIIETLGKSSVRFAGKTTWAAKRAPRKRTKPYTKYGYCPRCGTGYTRAEYHADCYRAHCDACRVAPWLLRLFVNSDPEIVWRAFQGSVRRDEHRDRVDAVCRAHDLPLSGATFAWSAQQGGKNAIRMHVDGAVVYLYPDHFEVVISPEKLTPWSKMVRARPDARAILSEIARALED